MEEKRDKEINEAKEIEKVQIEQKVQGKGVLGGAEISPKRSSKEKKWKDRVRRKNM